jgi:hypothetical protein
MFLVDVYGGFAPKPRGRARACARYPNFDSKAAGSVTFLALSAPRALYTDIPSTILGDPLVAAWPSRLKQPKFFAPVDRARRLLRREISGSPYVREGGRVRGCACSV